MPRRLFPLLASALALVAAYAQAADTPAHLYYRTDVSAVLSKAGCNLGACHGNGNGKGGFKLSLRGEDPETDYFALVQEQDGRRVNLVEPDQSLLLLKGSAGVAHEGGQRFAVGSPEYQVLREWLAQGARDAGTQTPKLTKLIVTPREQVLLAPANEVRITAKAQFSDGTERDVTRFAVYEPNNQGAKVSVDGVVTGLKFGESTILVRYLDQQFPVSLAFVPDRPGFTWRDEAPANYIDRHVLAKLQTLRMNPSPVSDDLTFIRRAYLDLLGMVPSPAAAQAFAAEKSPEKRERLVNRLLERPEFADYWALKWADLMRIEERQLDKQGMKVFHGWIREGIAKNKPLDQFAAEIIAARGSTFQNAPANWWRANRDPVSRGENTARVFLGTQLNCAQCHNHPFERWTQDDYYEWTSLFSRVDYDLLDKKRTDINDKNEFRGDQVVTIKASGEVINPRTGEKAKPRFLGSSRPQTDAKTDELLSLATWMRSSPLFARTQANRIWFHLMGRGIVEPVDDFRASNPPTHPALLEELTKDFASRGFDLRHLIRTIMASHAYQRVVEPNSTNAEDDANYARANVRRLAAEQLVDSLSLITGVYPRIPDFPPGTRLAQVPEGKKHYKPISASVDRFAATFGKPPRLIASECERSNDVALPQVFQLLSGPMLQSQLTDNGNIVAKMVKENRSARDMVDELTWRALTRPPTEEESERFVDHIERAPERRQAVEDVAWALLNAKEFLFRR